MSSYRRARTLATAGVAAIAVVFALLAGAAPGAVAATAVPHTVAQPVVQQISTDTLPAYKATSKVSAQHATELETDTFSWGSTVVSAFQVGRMTPTYGAQAIGWATSTDDGATWQHGILPGLTASSPQPNPLYPAAVDQSVSYSAATSTWLVPSVTYVVNGTALREQALLVNTSTDGLTWNTATTAVPANVDKAWSACDNTPTSPFYGRCYVAYSMIDNNYALGFVSSTDGGQTWSAPVTMPGSYTGYNTNIAVRPNGSVVVVATDATKNGLNGSKLFATNSADGGQTWSAPVTITTVKFHTPAGGVRAMNKPSVDVDASGVVYAAWADCRFRTSCAHDDLVYATSANGVSWSAPIRVPLDPVTSTTDRFIPGFAVAPGTSGATAQLAVVSYTYLNGTCTSTTCRLDIQYATSYNQGSTWSPLFTIDQTPMTVGWLAANSKGPMPGDYLSVSFCNGSAVAVVSLATGPKTAGRYQQSEWAMTLPPGWNG